MDHRYGSRFRRHLAVDLCKGGKRIGSYYTRDISLGGIFVEGNIQKISTEEIISLEIKAFHGYKKNIAFSAKALVIHISQDGVGLMWVDDTSLPYQPLYELVFNSRKDAINVIRRN